MAVSMTRLELNWDDRESRNKLDITSVQAVAAVWLADTKASRHAAMDIETVVDEPFSFAFNGLDAATVIGLFDEIARQFPTVRFYVRGIGEDFSNMWLREYFGGATVFAAGPFDHKVSEHLSNKGKSWFSRWLGK